MDSVDEEKLARRAARLRRRKAVVDAAIARADEERGVVIVITGNGKGKTTSAFGTLFRALGHGQRVGLVQFIKGTTTSGEIAFLEQCGGDVRYHAMATGFTWETRDWEADRRAAATAWTHAHEMLRDERLDLVVLDELTYMLKYRFLDAAEVAAAITARPRTQSVVATGRAAPPALLEIADTISEIREVRHAFHAGVKARAGIDF
ncbi:MAG: cob(I)yrinic acid a,c-diamide adenosyltransferase [Candidatus Accumulibacter sp.]|jgi:cob(I)alamin adenosyltransferase|nr:cob(I)yrinic acid a,c-diamide adenosyltransferase [Accumulibacter sp.]